MIKKLFYTFIALIALWFYSYTNSYINELVFLDEWKTIKELKENINDLDKINIELVNELDTLNTDYELKTFLRNDLSLIEFNKIKMLVSKYNINNAGIELVLINKAKDLLPVIEERKLLLEEKRKLYSWLVPYINNVFKDNYLEYIKWDAKIFNEQKSITTDIITKKEILNTKVISIENKIQEHNIYINDSIMKVIESKLDEKINNLNNNETFKMLNNESKIKILDKTISKVKMKLEDLENKDNIIMSWTIISVNLSVIDKKIQTFYIAINKLEEFRDSLIQKN